MAIVDCIELARSRGVAGKYRETSTYTREWLIRVDNPGTSLVDIVNENGVNYFDPHPDDPTCYALEYDCQCVDEGGLFYKNTVRYYVPPAEQWPDGSGPGQPDQPSWLQIPGDQWSAAASTVTGPVTRDINGQPITNSAKDPIGGLEKDHAEFRLTLVRTFLDLSWGEAARLYTNAVNSGSWNGGGPRTWKCHFQSASKVTENNQGLSAVYWSTTWDFCYREETWDLTEGCEDVGTMELAQGSKRVIQVNGSPVTGPVALLPTGQAAPPGTSPSIINGGAGVRVYRELDFSPFGGLS
jgi:hypothetical protein